ncbi:hypothetical protein PSTG_17741, partial [Puccinia striiformis f. sp. tritici PST-78]
MLQGCREHYRQSVSRIHRNRTIISADEVTLFRDSCMGLMKQCTPTDKSYEEQVDFIQRRFPRAKKWFDWWTTLDVASIVFPSRRPLVEDTADRPSPLPETTNAQESMHHLYYMISEGKQCLSVGMVELFTFVTCLEEDWKSVIHGVAISYGPRKQKDVGVSMGQAPKQKRQAHTNDGRPPDTTDELIEGNIQKKAKLGRPPGATNADKNRFTTYISYHALFKNPAQRNRCWLSAGLESLFALFSPLWLRGISGHGKDMFTAIVNHFTSRTTYELTLIELATDPQQHKSPNLKQLFSYIEHRTFTCEISPNIEQFYPDRANRSRHVVKISPATFSQNKIPYADVKRLLGEWETNGLIVVSGLSSPSSSALHHHSLSPSVPRWVAPSAFKFSSGCPRRIGLAFNQEFQMKTDWPFKLTLGGATYTLVSRGFWTGLHYYCKVLRTANKMTGVWLHDEAENQGYAQLINQVPSAIAGPQELTSWVMYSRAWTMDEEKYVEEAITKIRKNNPNPAGDIPFSTLKSILNASHTSVTTPLQESVAAASKVANPLDFGLLDSDLANLDDEDLVTTQVAETVQNDIYERPEEIAVESLPPSQNPPTQIRLKIKPIKKIPTPEEPFQSNSFLPKGPPNDMLPVAPKDVLPVLPKPKKFRPTKK